MTEPQFARQVETLVSLGYPAFFDLDAASFRLALAPLSRALPHGPEEPDLQRGRAPFVLVVNGALAPARFTLPLIRREGSTPVVALHPIALERFQPVAAFAPPADAYLMLDVDRVSETRNVAPDDALRSIERDGRTPLTIEEGIALLTQWPAFLQPNNCFSLAGSRCGDKRVPALWLSEGRPKLGWCWSGNPHTWLGSASCGARRGAVRLPAPRKELSS